MKIKFIQGLFLFILIPLIGFSQNGLLGKTCQLTIAEQTDLSSGNITQQASIVQLSDLEVIWGPTLEEGFTMSVSNTSGSWNETTNTGEVIYTLQLEDGSGTATLKGDSNGLVIILELTFSNGSSRLELKATGITYN